MLGLLRTTLSLFVFLSHMPKTGLTFALGNFSVGLFYFISGFLISRSYENFRAQAKFPPFGFYLDRMIRIYPGYAVSLTATALLVIYCRADLYTATGVFTPPEATGAVLRGNVFLFRLNMDVPALNTATWSLAAEMQFYLILPLIAVLPFPLFAAVVAASMGVQQFAFQTMPLVEADWWGYRSLWGMLFVFCMGICLARREDRRFARLLATVVLAQVVSLTVIYPMTKPFSNYSLLANSLSVLVAVPLVDFAVRTTTPWLKPIDRFVGDLCYPIFLMHVPAMYCADLLYPGGTELPPQWYALAIGLCALFALALHFSIQLPSEKLRYAIRGFARRKQPAV